jgi:hypothetical protein
MKSLAKESEMTKTVAMLLALILAACGSASQAGPKTSNPPLKPKAEPKPDPAETKPMEIEGRTLKLNQMQIRITLSDGAAWKAGAGLDAEGTAHLALKCPDWEAQMDMYGTGVPDADAQKVAGILQTMMASDANLSNVSVPADEGHGRWAMALDFTADGKAMRGYAAVMPHPSKPDVYLLVSAFAPAATADAFLKEVRATLDTVAPLK